MKKTDRILIVGAGQAGFSCAEGLKKAGHTGRITLFGNENALPYQRPPLTKSYLLGDMSEDRLNIRPESFFLENNIELRLGEEVKFINRKQQLVETKLGSYPYDVLVLATGSSPRRLPKAADGAIAPVHYIRKLKDIQSLRPSLRPESKLAIIGGGYIGLELAAVSRTIGLDVTVIESQPTILMRVAARETADWLRSLHIKNGVKFLENTQVKGIARSAARTCLHLDNEEMVEADVVVAGIGAVPNVKLARQAGLDVENGVAVDSVGRASDDAIWATGDCCSFPYKQSRIRLESVPHAIAHGQLVANNIVGNEANYRPVPWFWSDQYDVKFQTAGLAQDYDHIELRDTKQSRSVWYFEEGKLIAVDAMRDAKAFLYARKAFQDERVLGEKEVREHICRLNSAA